MVLTRIMLLIPLSLFLFDVSNALAQTKNSIASAVLESAIKAIPAIDAPEYKIQEMFSPDSSSSALLVNKSTLSEENKLKFTTDNGSNADVPFLYPNTMLIQLENNIQQKDLEDLLQKRDLKVIKKYPEIGAIQVSTDLSKYFTPELTDQNVNDTYLRGLTNAIEDFNSDPRIKNAAPDLLLREQIVNNLQFPTNIRTSAANDEVTDWGIADIEADQLWSMPGAKDGVIIGIMDAGFHRHEDLIFTGMDGSSNYSNHGNHVAGIACAKHNNRGIKGVIPNCYIRPKTGRFIANTAEGVPVLDFVTRFSDIITTLNQFVSDLNDIHTFNVSLGYNWRSNFGINPDLDTAKQWRAIVAAQGSFVVSILQIASQNDKVIFSAAGNDSTQLNDPIDARYASPFNWAAIKAREENIAMSGIIVEAHSQAHNRAGFSNEKGHLSCPGVDILSSIAYNDAGSLSRSVYGTMSGTSMASPYCAAGFTLLSLVRPKYSATELLECIMATPDKSSSGTPIMKLAQAAQRCPAR